MKLNIRTLSFSICLRIPKILVQEEMFQRRPEKRRRSGIDKNGWWCKQEQTIWFRAVLRLFFIPIRYRYFSPEYRYQSIISMQHMLVTFITYFVSWSVTKALSSGITQTE